MLYTLRQHQSLSCACWQHTPVLHQTPITQCCFKVGPLSSTLAQQLDQYWVNVQCLLGTTWHRFHIQSPSGTLVIYSTMQSQKAVTAHFSSTCKQLLPFGFTVFISCTDMIYIIFHWPTTILVYLTLRNEIYLTLVFLKVRCLSHLWNCRHFSSDHRDWQLQVL